MYIYIYIMYNMYVYIFFPKYNSVLYNTVDSLVDIQRVKKKIK